MRGLSWPAEQVSRLIELWNDGKSALQISARFAVEFPNFPRSRNSVISQVRRLRKFGVKMRGPNANNPMGRRSRKRKPAARARAKVSVPKASAPKVETAPPRVLKELPPVPVRERKTIETLGPLDCRWPIGDPLKKDFHFCGRGRTPGQPYCEHHMRVAFQPPQPRRQRVIVNKTTDSSKERGSSQLQPMES